MITSLRRIYNRPAVMPFVLGLLAGALALGLLVDSATTLGMLRNVALGSLLISFVVGIHEFSHLAMARALRLQVDEFGIGFGPRLAGIRLFGIDWRLRALPLGGYVKLHGENSDDGPGSFSTAPAWKKLVTFGAGPASNIALAWLLFAAIAFFMFDRNLPESFGLAGHAMREAVLLTWQLLSDGVGATIATGDMNRLPVGSLPQLMTASGSAFDAGPFMILLMSGLVSLSIGLFNFLPIPPLDGGQMLLVSLKSLLGRRYPDRALYRASMACLVLITLLGLGLVGLDLVRLLGGHFDNLGSLVGA